LHYLVKPSSCMHSDQTVSNVRLLVMKFLNVLEILHLECCCQVIDVILHGATLLQFTLLGRFLMETMNVSKYPIVIEVPDGDLFILPQHVNICKHS